MKRTSVFCVTLMSLFLEGCPGVGLTDSPNRLIGSDGQTFVLEDIQSIVGDPALSNDEKRSQLRSLGIEDEKLIDALLTL